MAAGEHPPTSLRRRFAQATHEVPMSGVFELLDHSLAFRLAVTCAAAWLGVRVLDRLLRREQDDPRNR
jgi:hypothetical protein